MAPKPSGRPGPAGSGAGRRPGRCRQGPGRAGGTSCWRCAAERGWGGRAGLSPYVEARRAGPASQAVTPCLGPPDSALGPWALPPVNNGAFFPTSPWDPLHVPWQWSAAGTDTREGASVQRQGHFPREGLCTWDSPWVVATCRRTPGQPVDAVGPTQGVVCWALASPQLPTFPVGAWDGGWGPHCWEGHLVARDSSLSAWGRVLGVETGSWALSLLRGHQAHQVPAGLTLGCVQRGERGCCMSVTGEIPPLVAASQVGAGSSPSCSTSPSCSLLIPGILCKWGRMPSAWALRAHGRPGRRA